jgi:hypothetical protein
MAHPELPTRKKIMVGKRTVLKRYEDFVELQSILKDSESRRPWSNRFNFTGIPGDSFTGFGIDKLDVDAAYVYMRRNNLRNWSNVSALSKDETKKTKNDLIST